VVMETVCDEDLWIWHLFVGCPGSHIDLNVMHVSPSIYPLRTENGRPVHFLTLLSARQARSYIILWMVFILVSRFSFLRFLTPQQKNSRSPKKFALRGNTQ